VDYAGPATASRTRYYWRVRVWDTHGRASPWSATSWWETGLGAGDWTAQWVGPPPAPSAGDSVMSPAPMLRSAVPVDGPVPAARGVTDGGGRTSPGAVLASDLYQGETYDARREQRGWDAAGFDDHAWAAADVLDAPSAAIIASISPPVRRVLELHPVSITRAP